MGMFGSFDLPFSDLFLRGELVRLAGRHISRILDAQNPPGNPIWINQLHLN